MLAFELQILGFDTYNFDEPLTRENQKKNVQMQRPWYVFINNAIQW